jgi:hypothetical protein
VTEAHLSLDALADLLAAEGSAADEAHVAGCAGCAGRLDELATAEVEVAAVLAALPAPAVPADLAARLGAALAAEPALVPAPPGEGPVALGEGARASGATVTAFPDAAPRRRRAWLPAAAAAAVLVVGGALVVPSLLGGAGGDDASTSAAGGAEAVADPFGDLARNETGTDYAADGSLAASLPALLGGSATPLTAALSTEAAPAGEDLSGGAAAAPAAPEAALEQRAAQDAGAADPALDRLRTPEGLASCLTALLPPDDDDLRPLAVDYAAYQGQPALVVLLPAGGAADKVDVFVVDAECAVGDDRTLFFTRLDRP